jgi:hypothetical protein
LVFGKPDARILNLKKVGQYSETNIAYLLQMQKSGCRGSQNRFLKWFRYHDDLEYGMFVTALVFLLLAILFGYFGFNPPFRYPTLSLWLFGFFLFLSFIALVTGIADRMKRRKK